ncbi:MAG: DsrE/DsrF/DrsH-like family protein [Eggerthellaceae bacterium]|nr:DsrE/DsrF/DrsH-like family protein [Eggerthellaceae bacterium]MBQ9044303.1 DsrE/DsrF/DrsH-like family protein [Eggerthellaceae bacterium]
MTTAAARADKRETLTTTEEQEAHDISAQDFAKLDFPSVTIVDVRDEDLRIAQGEFPGAFNVPFSQIGTGLSSLPEGKPVYVICNSGDFSEEVAEILADRGFEAYNVVGGYKAYKAAVAASAPISIDAKGLKCPGPIVLVADTIRELPVGQRIIVEATEAAFASDIRVWCARTGNELQSLDVQPDVITAHIVKTDPALAPTAASSAGNGKTFVVFSGDLDKTIAAFIMANGAASLGRDVTMFFTFWGLNILRKPQKVKVRKTAIGRAFGAMMPRGTKKLGLSRMNFGGAGAKMIRHVMKSSGISSLEELIDQARDHGVRLVACQMSMEIMGITPEELIDGVELGGVATFIGSGEESDMSLFI